MAHLATVARIRNGLSHEAVLTSVGSLASTGLAGLTSILVARELGVSGRGAWAVISSLAVLVGTFATLGLPQAAGYAAARLHGESRWSLIDAAIRVGVGLSLLGAGVYAVASRVSTPEHTSHAVVLAGAAIAAGVVFGHVIQGIVLTAASLPWFVAVQVVPSVAVLTAVVVISIVGTLRIEDMVVISALSLALAAGVGVIGLARFGALRSTHFDLRGRQSFITLRPYLAFALLTLGTVAMTQVVQRIDILLVGNMRGVRDAGLYAVAVQFGDLLLVVPSALGSLVFRRGARSSEGHYEDAMRALRWTAIGGMLAAGLLALVAGPVIDTLFGAGYAGSRPALLWLLPGVVLLGVQSVVSSYVASRGRPRSVLVAWGTAALVGVGLDVIVIPTYGIVGAAAVSSLSYLVVVAMHAAALRAVRPVPA